MTDLSRCLAEQQQAARYLTDPSLCAEYAATHHVTPEHAREGAAMAIFDWTCEEILLRLENQPGGRD